MAYKNGDGVLTVSDFKGVLMELKVTNELEVDILVQFFDNDGDKYIKIDEFFNLLKNVGSIQFNQGKEEMNFDQIEKNKITKKLLLEIRGLMSFNLFEYFTFFDENELPSFFEPSFLQTLIERECKNQPSYKFMLQNNFQKQINYENAEQLANISISDNLCIEIKIKDIENIPIQKKNENILQRELRVILYDGSNQFISNVYVLPAQGAAEG